jgi:hypothetical protein
MPRKKLDSVEEALEAFLADLEPAGADRVRAALARELAATVATAPPYVLPKIAHELAELLDTLAGPARREWERHEQASRKAEAILAAVK